jgi:2-dehydropantoate 2-reductase
VVLLTTKAHQLLELVPGMQALFGPETMVVSMVNGIPWWYFQKLGGAYEARQLRSVDPDGALGAGIDVNRIIGGIVYPAAELLEPGVVKVIEGNRFTLGELDNQRTPRIEALSKSMMAAGFKAPVSRDIRSEIWVKLWGNLTFNPVSALSHATLEDICTYPLTRELAQRMMQEAQHVGEKLGVTFKVSIDQRIAGAQAVGAHKTSMLQDVEQGRALELEALLGSVVELARITDSPSPTLDAIYAVTSLLSHTLTQQGGKLALQKA